MQGGGRLTLTHDIRAEAQKEGMIAMARKFREQGEVYLPLRD